jgi:protein ImuB
MLWAALLFSPSPDDTPPSNDDALRGLATWALQFTPRVAVADDAVTMEVEASLRLFGGKRALRDRVVDESRELGVGAVAWAPTSLAAIAFCQRSAFTGQTRIGIYRPPEPVGGASSSFHQNSY